MISPRWVVSFWVKTLAVLFSPSLLHGTHIFAVVDERWVFVAEDVWFMQTHWAGFLIFVFFLVSVILQYFSQIPIQSKPLN